MWKDGQRRRANSPPKSSVVGRSVMGISRARDGDTVRVFLTLAHPGWALHGKNERRQLLQRQEDSSTESTWWPNTARTANACCK